MAATLRDVRQAGAMPWNAQDFFEFEWLRELSEGRACPDGCDGDRLVRDGHAVTRDGALAITDLGRTRLSELEAERAVNRDP